MKVYDESMSNIETAKKLQRKEIWARLERDGIARFPLPCYGRIPNFDGSEEAADRVRLLREWKEARVVFANPDYAQRKVREYALIDGRVLVMASPRLKHGFVVVDPKDIRGRERFASTIKGAFRHGRTVGESEIPRPNLIVEGSVAVDADGHRLGKGGGYGDVEIEVLTRLFGKIPVVTTVHDVQIVGAVPFEEKDKRVSMIVTPKKVVYVSE